MLSKTRRALGLGFGRPNRVVQTIQLARQLKQADDEMEAKAVRSRPQAAPMVPAQRELNYRAQTGRLTPAQRRRAQKKEQRGWRKPGSVGPNVEALFDEAERVLAARSQAEVETILPDWDPEQCSCHINPPCAYCESAEYKEP